MPRKARFLARTLVFFFLGVTVTKCPLCLASIPAYYDLGIYYTEGAPAAGPHIDLIASQPLLTSWINILDKAYAYFDIEITVNGSSPHFVIEKSSSSKQDAYTSYFGPVDVDYTDATAAAPYLMDATGTNDELMVPQTAAGNYTFVVNPTTVLGGSSTQFRLTFTLNVDSTQSYPAGNKCPSMTCLAQTSCSSCINSLCYWCQSQFVCQEGSVCGAAPTPAPTLAMPDSQAAANATVPPTPAPTPGSPSAPIMNGGTCPDQSAICTAIMHCSQCVPTKGCLWCNTLGAIGGNSGSCSAGFESNGQKCTNLLTNPYTVAMCPASHVALTISVLLIALSGLF